MDESQYIILKKVLQNQYGYQLKESIGEGGFGDVFKVTKDGNNYALKVILETGEQYLNLDSSSASKYKGFKNEIDMLKKVNSCQNKYKKRLRYLQIIPEYITHFKFSKTIYYEEYDIEQVVLYKCIIMELFDGDLQNIKYNKDIPKFQIRDNLDKLSLALEIVNLNCNVCFSDIKPKNLLYKYNKKSKELVIVFADTGSATEYSRKCSDYNNFNKLYKDFL